MIKYLIIVTVCCLSFVLCATSSVADQGQMTTMSDTELEASYRETLDTYFSKNQIPQELRDLIANKFMSLSQWTFLNQYYCSSCIRLFRQLVDRVSQSDIFIKTEELWEFCLYLGFRNMERQAFIFAKEKNRECQDYTDPTESAFTTVEQFESYVLMMIRLIGGEVLDPNHYKGLLRVSGFEFDDFF